MQPAALESIGQGTHDMLLAGEFGECLGPPLAGEGLIGHRVRAPVERSTSKGGGEPYPRHLQRIAMAASFRTWPGSSSCNAGRPAVDRCNASAGATRIIGERRPCGKLVAGPRTASPL